MEPKLFQRLDAIARERCANREPAHDYLHVKRVAASARALAEEEAGDLSIVVPAALLHELFNHPKGHPESHMSGEICAVRAAVVLREEGCPAPLVEPICYAIRVHPFSRGIVPETLEAKILQDADRLDAIGAIGVARCFATCAEMRRPFYADTDAFCRSREPDGKAFGVDHFFEKLLGLAESMHTDAGRRAAKERAAFMQGFLAQLEGEISAS
jgi:uncharacterized protein